ncbi:MAG: hypothetical protein ACU85V_08615 [Gammaproteobacteria bacterium]
MRTSSKCLLAAALGLVLAAAAPGVLAHAFEAPVIAPRSGHWGQLGNPQHYGRGQPAIHRYGYHYRPRLRGHRYAYPGHGYHGYRNPHFFGHQNPRFQPYFRGYGARPFHGYRFGGPSLYFRYRH